VIPTADQEKADWSTLTNEEISNLDKQNIFLSNMLDREFNVLPYPLETMTNQMEKLYCENIGRCYSQYESEFGVVHVVQTSLQDPKMFHVWRRFCFALESQTTNRFLWILRVVSDEWLIREVKKPIRKTPLHIIVAKSNSTSALPFRYANALQDLQPNAIIHGDKQLLEYFHNRAQTQPLLETFLSPTDALDKSFLLRLQNTTAEHLKSIQLEKDSWYYQCVPNYIEWTFRSSDAEPEFGSLQVTPHDEERCIHNPGTSRVSLPAAQIPQGVSSDTGLCPAAESIKKGCIFPIKNESPLAARVIIPSSIDSLTTTATRPNSSDRERRNQRQDGLVMKMKNDFAIPPIFLKQMRNKLSSMNAWGL